MEGPRIYNLFPPLAGPMPNWTPHLERVARMQFNWVFVNPVQMPGLSGSIYSIRDYYRLNPLLVGEGAGLPEDQLRQFLATAHALGLQVMIDLVINHTAVDCPLIQEHPEWYQRDQHGGIVHPGAEGNGERVIWGDLAAVDNAASPDRNTLWQYWLNLVLHYSEMGFDGFRCDAAYQVPAELWRFLIDSATRRHPRLQFFAETLGCTPDQTREVAGAGFDFIFNSSKWWDFAAPWCLEQYELLSPVVPSVSFPESHDTERVATELNGNHAAVRQRLVLAAFFSTGVMVPMGFEYGFRRRLHVVRTRPSDWEAPGWDDTEFVGRVNGLKRSRRVWNEEGPMQVADTGNPLVTALRQSTSDGQQTALLLFNRDLHQPQTTPRGAELSAGMTELSSELGTGGGVPYSSIQLPPAGFRVFASSSSGL